MYSIAHFFARRRTPGKNKTIIVILQFYPQSHSEYYAPCWGKFFSFCFSFSHLLVIVYSFSFRSPVFC